MPKIQNTVVLKFASQDNPVLKINITPVLQRNIRCSNQHNSGAQINISPVPHRIIRCSQNELTGLIFAESSKMNLWA
jgi:hypothetical protein